MPKPNPPVFSQLDRLADNEEWRDWKREGRSWTPRQGKSGRANRRMPLDQIITDSGIPQQSEEN